MPLRRLLRGLRSLPLRGTAWGTIDQGFRVVVGVLSLYLLAGTIGPEQYGLLVGLFGLVGPLGSLSQAGLPMAIIEHISRHGEKPGRVLGSATSIASVVGVLVAPVLLLAAGRLVPDMPLIAASSIIVAELVFSAGFAAARATVQATSGFALASRLHIGMSMTRGVLLVGLWLYGISLVNYAIGYAAVVFLWWAISLGYLGLRGVSITSLVPARAHMRSMFVYGVGVVATAAQAQSDRTVLTANGLTLEAGFYGAAYRIFSLSRAPMVSLVAATHVGIVSSGASASQRVRRAVRLSLLGAAYGIGAAVLLFLLAPLITYLVGDDFGEAVTVLRWLAPLSIVGSAGGYAANALIGFGGTNTRTVVQVVSAVFTVGLYVALIPRFGWRGAVVATGIGDTVRLAAMWVMLLYWARRARSAELREA